MRKTIGDLLPGTIGFVRPNERLMGVDRNGRLWMFTNIPAHAYNDGGSSLLVRCAEEWRVELQGDLGSFRFTVAEPPTGSQVVYFRDLKIDQQTSEQVPSHFLKK